MDEIKQIAADHFKNATKEDISILVNTLKNKISAYLMKLNGLTSEEIETTVFSKIKQTMQQAESATNILSVVKSNTGSVNSILSQYESSIQQFISQANRSEELVKEGYVLINEIADTIHGYKMQYQVSIFMEGKSDLQMFTLSLEQFVDILSLSASTGRLKLKTRFNRAYASALLNKKFSEQKVKDINQNLFNQMLEHFPKERKQRGWKGRAIEVFQKMSFFQQDAGKQLSEEEAFAELGENLAFYRGPDYWIQQNGLAIAIQSKLYNASVSLSTIEGALNRIIVMISTLEGVLDGTITAETLGLKVPTDQELVDQIVQSVFGV